MKTDYKPHTRRLKKVDQYVRALFKDELPSGIKFHDANHTLHPNRGVVAVANRIALSEKISAHDRELVIAAAYFHDTGYIREYDKNEPIAARIAGRILKLLDYKPGEVEKVQKMILATDLAKKPKTHLVIRGFQMRHASTLALANWAAVNLGGGHNRVEDCVVSWMDYNGFGATGSHITVKNCTFAYCGLMGLVGGGGQYHLYENCRILHNNLDNYNPGGTGAGNKFIYLSDSVVRNVEAAYNCGPGLWLDWGNFNNTIENCRCHDNQGPGIFIEDFTISYCLP